MYIIAEIGQAHDGSLGVLHSYIDALAETGVDAIKFQTHIAEAESSVHEPFRVNFSYEDSTRYDYWKRMEFSVDQWKAIKLHCDQAGLDFISSPFSNAAVDLLEDVGVKSYKIGSGEVSNFLLLEKVARTKKSIILSSGLSSYDDIENAINFLAPFGNDVSVLQCTTKYPTQAKDIGLNIISEMKNKFNLKVGLSDHSGEIFPSLAATSLGANILEFHAVFDKRMFGPDSESSLEIDKIIELVKGVRFIESSLGNKIDKNDLNDKKDLKKMFGKSLAVNKDLDQDSIITFDDLEAKKPEGYGIPAMSYQKVIGKKLNKKLVCWSFLNEDDLI